MSKGWIGVDLDGTAAHYDTWKGPDHIGEPVPAVVERIKQKLAEGFEVRIFTARVYAPPDDTIAQAIAAISLLSIQTWCQQYIGQVLPVTCCKDMDCIEIWDDRCVHIETNTGEILG